MNLNELLSSGDPRLNEALDLLRRLGFANQPQQPVVTSKIQELVKMLRPLDQGCKTFDVGDNFLTMHLKVADGSVVKNGKEVRKITFWFNPEGYQPEMQVDTNSPKCRFSLLYADKTKEAFQFLRFFPVAGGIHYVMMQYIALVEAGAEVESGFLHQEKRVLLDWTSGEYADPNIPLYYTISRAKIAGMFVSKIKQNPALLEKARLQGMQLFSFGCGDGSDIQAVQKAVSEAFVLSPEAFGMDNNPNCFDKTAEGVTLEEGDIEAIDTWLIDKQNDNAMKIGLFMGTLTHMVSRSSYAALKSLHAVKGFDLVLVGGYTPVLLTQRIFKAAGWNVQLRTTNSHFNDNPATKLIKKPNERMIRPDMRSHYILEPMSPETRKAYLEARGTKGSTHGVFDCLDLSFSSKPLEDLLLFEQLKQHRQVDISWCDFTDESLRTFLEKLESRIDSQVHLAASGDEPWFSAFTAITSPKFIPIQRLDHRKGELAAISPATAKRIGVYSSLPYESIAQSIKNE